MLEHPDRELVLRTRAGDTNAYGELVKRYQSPVFNVCYRLLGHAQEAEDQTQETFLRGYQRLNTFDEARPFGPWIRRVAANLCFTHLKRKRLKLMPLEEEWEPLPVPDGNSPETALVQVEKNRLVRNAILELPSHYRVVIELRHYQELSYKEISQALDIPVSDVKSHLFRARKMLARSLKQDECSPI